MSTDDDRQDSKKRGLFSRLFGRKQDTSPDEETTSQETPQDGVPPESPQDGEPATFVPEPEPVVPEPEPAVADDNTPDEPEPEPAPEDQSAAEPEPPVEPAPETESDDDRQDGRKRGLFSRLFSPGPGTPPDEETAPQETSQDDTIPEQPPADGPQPEPEDEAGPEPELPVEPVPEPETEEEAEEDPDDSTPKASWWRRLKDGLSRTSSSIGSGIVGIFTKRKLDFSTLEELEDILIQADLGVGMATRVTEAVGKGRYDKTIDPEEVKAILAREITAVLEPVAKPLVIDAAKKPFVILMIGVNGAGKTTTIGKLSQKFRNEGRSVMLAAGDTFRAAAIEQLSVWGERTGARVIRREQGADAAGLAFDALKEANDTGTDVLLIDTAGRLQNKAGLMAELEKVIRVIKKRDETAPHAVLLVLDATTGQNAVNQVEIFGQMAGVTGLVMTKLDGTARGGILVAIADKFGLPVHFIGVGEGVEDLEPFAANDFARAIAGLEEA